MVENVIVKEEADLAEREDHTPPSFSFSKK
jgi:hypothetical protein